jgi:hypothetical protein
VSRAEYIELHSISMFLRTLQCTGTITPLLTKVQFANLIGTRGGHSSTGLLPLIEYEKIAAIEPEAA